MIGLTLLLVAAPAPQPPCAQGVEGLLDGLRERSSLRREAAEEVWEEHGPAFLENPLDAPRLQPLVEHAPEIQEPALRALEAWRAEAEPLPESGAALVRLLGLVMNPAGADRLADLLDGLPPEARLAALPACVSRGGIRGVRTAERWLAKGRSQEKQVAVDALLRHGDPERAAEWLELLPFEQIDASLLGAALTALAARPGLSAEFELPEALLRDGPPEYLRGVLDLLSARPRAEAEGFASDLAVKRSVPAEVRRAALRALEAGAEPFRWRLAPRRLADFLEGYPTDPLAEDVAWTLHRMGHRDGARFLTAGPEAALRANPKDYRARMRLGTTYVELGKFRDAYREFREAIQDIEGTQSYRNVAPLTWVYAARAASGARRFSDAAEWLGAARMSPQELAPYRDLPEFQAALSKPAFRRLFGLD